ncbi:C40 family peptidase [Demequina salsinemoris]|uniref:C40 family peptidase n=1 Tax=Demequina salsinemoris TaxID=577470 RepID=UPI0007843550|nr:C40 family peptidase [Demequina salsinemoris]
MSRQAGKTWTREVLITNAYGRQVKLQVKRDGGWKTIQTKRADDTRLDTVVFRFKGGDDTWYANDHNRYLFRVVVGGTRAIAPTQSKALVVKPTMRYRAASGYLQPVTRIRAVDGGYALTPGRNGNKVKLVQRALGMGSRWETMDSATVARVKAFQHSHGLRATGTVNRATWLALGLSSRSWTSVGGYTHEVVADRSATRRERIEIMIDTALEYVGSDYVWGGAGTPGQGADCSGMVMQALYAAGMPTGRTNVARHSLSGFRSTRALYASNFKHVPFSHAKRGDLVFFTGNGGTYRGITHMGIYLGDGKMIDLSTSRGTAQVRSVHVLDPWLDIVPQAVRVFS